MNLLIIARNSGIADGEIPPIPSTAVRVAESARRAGMEVRCHDPFSLYAGPSCLYSRGMMLEAFDIVFVRTTVDAAEREYILSLARSLEHGGARVINSSSSIERASDKFRTFQALSAAHVPAVPSMLVHGAEQAEPAIAMLGGCPVMVKFLYGTHGTGVIKAESPAMVKALIRSFGALGVNVCIQPFVAESAGETIRILVSGKKCLGALSMTPAEGEWCSNFHRGGDVRAFRADKALKSLALKAIETLGLHYGGVDILMSRSGPLVLEVNSSPGVESFDRVLGTSASTGIVSSFVE